LETPTNGDTSSFTVLFAVGRAMNLLPLSDHVLPVRS
jgi:hypothetical protein